MPYAATRGGLHRPGGLARPPREPCGLSLDLTVPMVAFRHPRAAISVPVLLWLPRSGPELPGSTRPHESAFAAAGDHVQWSALGRQRSDRASWTRSPNTRPAFQAPIACHVGCWIRRPVAGRRRPQYEATPSGGDKLSAHSLRMVNWRLLARFIGWRGKLYATADGRSAPGGAAGEDAAAQERALQRAVAVHAAAAEARHLARRIDVAERRAVGLEHARRQVGLQAAQRLARQDPEPHRDQRSVGRDRAGGAAWPRGSACRRDSCGRRGWPSSAHPC